jgi:hypothetical protein
MYSNDRMEIPLKGNDTNNSQRVVIIPKNLTAEEMQYVHDWFNLWKDLPVWPAPTQQEPEPTKK